MTTKAFFWRKLNQFVANHTMISLLKTATLSFLLIIGASMFPLFQVLVCESETNHVQTKDAPNAIDPHQDVRVDFDLPKMLTFDQFKATFNKRYHSTIEEIIKRKLYLMRSFQAFISSIAYKYRQSSFFKSINSRSDWTRKERESIRNKRVAHFSVELADETVNRRPAGFWSKLFGSKLDDETEEIVDTDTDGTLSSDDLEQKCSPTSTDVTDRAWCILNMPNYRRVYLNEISHGQTRNYKHLPVKSNFRLLPETTQENAQDSMSYQAFDVLWNNLWHGTEEDTGKDIVWVDHRESGCLQTIQDQADCGSCYAFTTVAFIEWAYCKQTGEKVKFSEQYIVDCGKDKPKLYGCEGGATVNVAEFILNFGLELANSYPYKHQLGQCPYKPEVPLNKMGLMRVDLTNITSIPIKLFDEYLEYSPIIVSIEQFNDFDDYGGGVYNGRQCQRSTPSHAVLLVGHGRQDGEEYWLIRNSFGDDWGESGHMKLNKNTRCISPKFGFILGSKNGKDVQLRPRLNVERINKTPSALKD